MICNRPLLVEIIIEISKERAMSRATIIFSRLVALVDSAKRQRSLRLRPSQSYMIFTSSRLHRCRLNPVPSRTCRTREPRMRCGLPPLQSRFSGTRKDAARLGRHHRARRCAFQLLRKWPNHIQHRDNVCASGMFRHCPRPKRLFGATSLPGQGRLPILPRTGWRWTWRSPIVGQGIKFAPNRSQSGATDRSDRVRTTSNRNAAFRQVRVRRQGLLWAVSRGTWQGRTARSTLHAVDKARNRGGS